MKTSFISNSIIVLLLLISINVLNAESVEATRKSFFLSSTEKEHILAQPSTSPTSQLLAAMQARVNKRATTPNLSDKTSTTVWWHHASDYLTDAALIHSLRPTPNVDAWLRSCVLSIVRRPLADWSGPGFRAYDGGELVGQLETAHLAWGVAIAYDLASDLFTTSESEEIKDALRNKGLIPCRRYLDQSKFFHNWNCVLLAGYSVAAIILGDETAIAHANAWLPVAADHFQADGSYGESLQYGNYAAFSLMIAQEALFRYNPSKSINLEPYARIVDWSAYAFLYRKPLSGWPIMDWPRTINFGDCGSIFRPSGDLLIHIAARAKKSMPQQASLASWLFNSLYFPANEPGPHDLAGFGFVNGFGFLSVILLADAAPSLSPVDLKFPLLKTFSGGDAFVRDSWNGLTTLGVRIPAEPRHATPHIHGDINSFILSYNRERLLVDPGHTCYRNIERDLDISSLTHNTCTFETVKSDAIPSRTLTQTTLTQNGGINRQLIHENGLPHGSEPIDLGGKRIINSRIGNVSVIGADAASLYGAPLKKFTRFFVLCGSHALFIVDQIESEEPLRTTWNFLLNNRDGLLDFQLERPSKITAKRGNGGLKIWHFAKDNMIGPIYALMHDAYHTLSAQSISEGEPGSGILMRWTESIPTTKRILVHALAMDDPAAIETWKSYTENNSYSIEGKDRDEKWTLQIAEDGTFKIKDVISKQNFIVTGNSGNMTLKNDK